MIINDYLSLTPVLYFITNTHQYKRKINLSLQTLPYHNVSNILHIHLPKSIRCSCTEIIETRIQDEEPAHLPKDHFSFGVSWVAHHMDHVAHKDLLRERQMDSQASKQAKFHIL